MNLDPTEILVGGLTREALMDRLTVAGVRLNPHAQVLLNTTAFDARPARPIVVTTRSVADLGLTQGATYLTIFDAARRQGLSLCPVDTAPYLRLAFDDQSAAPDAVMSSGRAPSGSLTVASEPVEADHDFPKGFYLRVVEGTAWLRGYMCDDQHVFAPQDRFAFQAGSGQENH